MGAWAAQIFAEQGATVIAVSDAFGAVRNDKGLDVPALRQHLAGGGSLDSFQEGTLLLRLPLCLKQLCVAVACVFASASDESSARAHSAFSFLM